MTKMSIQLTHPLRDQHCNRIVKNYEITDAYMSEHTYMLTQS